MSVDKASKKLGGARVKRANESCDLVPERKLGFFVKIKEDKIKEDENFNHRNTGSISRIKI